MAVNPHELEQSPDYGPYGPRVLGALTIERLRREDMRDILIPEADEEIVATLRDRPEGPVLLGCGDDRGLSPESTSRLEAADLPANRPYLRYFGGVYGVARVSMVAASTQQGPGILKLITPEKGFVEFSSEFGRLSEETSQVIPVAHSATDNELDEADLNPRSTTALGCAYAFNIGQVAYIAGHDKTIQRLSAEEFRALFGPFADEGWIETVAEGNRHFAEAEFGREPKNFSITRSDLLSSGTPAMILEGEHAKSQDTFLLANFSTNKLSDPQAAQEISRPYYGIDFTQTAEVIMRSMPELKLDPRVLMATMTLDVCATRAALAAHDGPANPKRIPIVSFGDPEAALDYLQKLQ